MFFVHLRLNPLSCKPFLLQKFDLTLAALVGTIEPKAGLVRILSDGETAWKSNKQGHLFADA